MDGPKLTRNQSSSSLLRSIPTVRSSIHSLTSVAEEDVEKQEIIVVGDESEKRKKPNRTGSSSVRFTPVHTMVFTLTFFTLISLSFFFFFFFNINEEEEEEIPTSENLLLALIFIAITLFFASKNKPLINQNLTLIKQLWEDNSKRFNLYSKPKSKPVTWFIGDQSNDNNTKIKREKKIIREGVEFYSNGDFYEGEFHKGKSNGSGVYNYFVNGRYEGDWVDGRYDGYGIESWSRGSRYKGQYRQGLRHGYGVYKFFTGDCYSGEWLNGQSHGFGVQSCSDGSCYIGQFKCGVKHGLGVYHFRNGDRYAGEYFRDKIHGFGVYHFANGHCYEGSWHEGRKQGYGMYTFRSSDAKCGEWDGGLLKTPLPPLTDAVLRAVQGARRTAESAVHLCRVDDQVNKAVQSANRAATAARVAAIKAVQNRMDGKFCDTNM